MSGKEMGYIQEAFDTNWVAPLGKNVEMFEKEMCAYIGRPYAVALSAGTAAIHLGLKYLGVERGDVVFCSSFTFSGSCNPAAYLGAKLVFIDCDRESYNMSPAALEKAYEQYPDPKAVIIVNLYGNPAEFDELLAITRKHGTPVLEDSAESLGASYKGVKTGNFGDISIFSFNGNKIITTSGGGMLMCNDQKSRDKVLFWATQSREKFPWYQHEEIGYNYRLSNICAGIGRGQMEVLETDADTAVLRFIQPPDTVTEVRCWRPEDAPGDAGTPVAVQGDAILLEPGERIYQAEARWDGILGGGTAWYAFAVRCGTE